MNMYITSDETSHLILIISRPMVTLLVFKVMKTMGMNEVNHVTCKKDEKCI
jgi:dTDP-glucose pyrophosphorylase